MLPKFSKKWMLGVVLAVIFAVMLGSSPFEESQHTTYAQTNLQADACNSMVEEALRLVAIRCLDVGRNEACYGNSAISATLNDDSLSFAAPGDIIPISAIDALITRPINPDAQEWGVAILNLQADLPDQDDSVQILVFGGAQVSPTVTELAADTPTCNFTNSSGRNLNLRAGPGENFAVFDVLDADDPLQVYGRSADGGWLRSSRGWVFAADGTLDCASADELRLIENTQDIYSAPMQSFTLRVDDEARCDAVPSGLLIQSPTGQTANLQINNVELKIGSTAFISMGGNQKSMTVTSLDGNVDVVNAGVPLPVGGQLQIQMNEEGGFSGDPDDVGEVEGAGGNVPQFVEQLTYGLGDPDNPQNAFDGIPAPPEWTPVSPTVDFTADTTDIVRGTCAVLTWAVEDAEAVTLNGALVSESSTLEICPPETTTYALTGVALRSDLANTTVEIEITVTAPIVPTEDPITDTDGDTVEDTVDNCPDVANRDQVDTDFDGQGNLCDPDDDNDQTPDSVDNCPLVAGTVAGCPDDDGDGVRQEFDNCPTVANAVQTNTDGDSFGDACDPDDDNDGVLDTADNCPLVVGSAAAGGCPDGDGDTVPDQSDNCATVANTNQANMDGDGLGDACDSDNDNDGLDDGADNCPFVANSDQADWDEDGQGDVCDPDDDNDGVADPLDNCPLAFDPSQIDTDGDGPGDVCDPIQADIAVLVTVTNPNPAPGELVTFTLTVTNNGPNAADVTVDIGDVRISGGTGVGGAYLWQIGVMNPGQVVTQTLYSANVTADLYVAYDSSVVTSSLPDPVGSNNSSAASFTVPPPQADIAVLVTVTNPNPIPGELVTITLYVTNNGPYAADVTVGIGDMRISGGTGVGGSAIWPIGILNPAQTVSMVLYNANVTADLMVRYDANVSASNLPDPNTSNDSGMASFTVP